nr:ATP-binding protein [Ornithinimicrobium pratense]
MSWFTLESLTAAIGRAAVDGTVSKVWPGSPGPSRSSFDDIGMLPFGQAAAEALYRLVDATYERRSPAVTSNIDPSGCDTVMPKTLATAAVDRFLHHAHVLITEGTSLRLAEATTGRGGDPLNLTARGTSADRGQGDERSASGEIYCPPTGKYHCPLTLSHTSGVGPTLDAASAALHRRARWRRAIVAPRAVMMAPCFVTYARRTVPQKSTAVGYAIGAIECCATP